ncbi:MAG TPA: serine/threonine-protein kinase [Stellaceae bacterium]|nr:serine/threonine-protein kinase [Stellaceae bacterium]
MTDEGPRYPGRMEAFLDGQLSFDELRIALLAELRQSPERRAGCAAFLDDLVSSSRLTRQLRASLLEPLGNDGAATRRPTGDEMPGRGILSDLLHNALPASTVSVDDPDAGEDATIPLNIAPPPAEESRLEMPPLPPAPSTTAGPDAVGTRGAAQEVDEALLNDWLKTYRDSRVQAPRDQAADQRLDLLLADWRGTRLRRQADRLAKGAEPAAPLAIGESPGNRPRRISVGTIIKDRFVIESLLGRGGMGRVFRAVDRRMVEAENASPYVALKVLNDDFARHPRAFQALEREARKAQLLNHPNVINVFDVDRDGRCVYIVMECLNGAPLGTVLRARGGLGLRPEQATPIIAGVCAALSHAHAHGIVHSDFKPANIFVCDDGTVKVLDFGIARASAVRSAKGVADRFEAASLGGMTPAYASPEIIENGAADPRDDVYALGCVAYLLLQGDHPFARKSSVDARNERLEAAPIAGLAEPAMAAIRQALEFQRERRTASVEEFRRGYIAGLDAANA